VVAIVHANARAGRDHGSWQPLGLELLLPEAEAQSILESLRERPAAGPDRGLAHRQPACPPGAQSFPRRPTPIEAGLDPVLSFAKGCYVGQEVVAMATYRGRVAWNLVRLEVAGEAPAPGTRIDPERGAKGRVTSSTQIGPAGVLLGWGAQGADRARLARQARRRARGRRARPPYGSLPGAGCAHEDPRRDPRPDVLFER